MLKGRIEFRQSSLFSILKFNFSNLMMKYITFLAALCLFLLASCHKAEPFDESGYDERLSGGMATVFDETSGAFGHEIAGLSERDEAVHELGDVGFEQTFVTAPAPINSGLGPIFNNVSCVACHHNDGKGTPTAGTTNSSLLFRLSVPGTDEHGGPKPIDGFGGQLQDLAVFGHPAEAQVEISYIDSIITYVEGQTVSLRKPIYTVTNPYMPLPANYLISPRLAPPVFGLGLLENIPEATILSFADEFDADGDGISGKANYVWNWLSKQKELGRFGLKASNPKVLTQTAGAYNQDMGVTSYVVPKESAWGQAQFDGLEDDSELPDTLVDAVAFYVKTLAVPARRNVNDPQVKAGKALFSSIGCAACHKPVVQTGVNLNLAALNNQRIQPYTDLLVHDMGSGLSDGRPDFLADGNEWRTSPLWGVGLFEKTNGIPYFLHDGRARSIEEAILWHGGEGEKSKNKFVQLSKSERDLVIKFVKSL